MFLKVCWLRTLLPRYELGTIVTVFGATALAIRTKHGTVVTRHLSDLRTFHEGDRFYLDPDWQQNEEAIDQEERGVDLQGKFSGKNGQQQQNNKGVTKKAGQKVTGRKNNQQTPVQVQRRSRRLQGMAPEENDD